MNDTEWHVIFGTGPIGTAVMDELVKRGKCVRMVNRSGKVADLPNGVEIVAGDATDLNFSRKVCEGASVVYNCLNPSYDKWLELFPALQAGAMEGASSAGAKFIIMDNLYMYGSPQGKPMTEELPYSATTRKGKLRAQMSRDAMQAHEKGKVRVAIGRASDYFGPKGMDSAMGERVFGAAIAGKSAQVLGKLDLPHTQSYIPDIGKGLVVLGERDEAMGQMWHLPAPRTVTQRQFIEMIYAELGKEAKIQVAPKFLVRVMGLFNPILHEIEEMLYEFEEPFVMDTSKFNRAFGDHATLLEEAIRTTVQWFQEHHHPNS